MKQIRPPLAQSLSVLLLGTAASVAAQDAGASTTEPAFAAHARIPHALPAGNREDPTAASTTVTMADRPAAFESVGDVLAEVPGVRPYRTGTLGSFTSASLWGTEVDHTAIVLGDLPIRSADAAAFDLSTIPASLLDRVVVYRGGAPVWLSQGAIGGVIQLVPRRAHTRTLGATATLGTYGLWGLEATSSLVPSRPDDGPSLFTAAGVIGSEGDFPYLSDNGTVLDADDDREVRRRNGDVLEGHGFGYLRTPALGGNIDVVALGFERVGGEPVSPADPAYRTRRNFTRALGMASWQREAWSGAYRRYRVQLLGGASYQRSRFTDLFGEIGTVGPGRTDDQAARGFGRLAWSLAATPWLEVTALATAERERFAPDSAFALVPVPDSRRDTLATAAELNAHGRIARHRFELRPSVRYEHSDALLHSELFRALVATDTARGAPAYRTGGVLELWPGVALSASASTGQRAPSLLELFGDGALLDGNPGLDPEHAGTLDAGMTASGRLESMGGAVEFRVFRTWLQDMIVWTRNGLRSSAPRNLGDGDILGVEAGLHGGIGRHLGLTAAGTLLDTEGKPGKELPQRARYTALVRPELNCGRLGELDAWRWFVEGRVVGPSYDDPGNVNPPSPTQLFIDVGTTLAFLSGAAELRVTARDLFDRGGYDVRGFQLPGRVLMASLNYKEGV